MALEHLLSERTKAMGTNVIREILKVVNQPGMVSLAGGIPAPESFPMDIFQDLCESVLNKYGSNALQYDVSEGFHPLREALVPYLQNDKQVKANFEDILVFSGSQSVLDNIGKILLSPGDIVALESPSYLGAISAFNAYQPKYIGIETDEHGMIPESLERVLQNNEVKFVYLVPTFQNPTGRTMTLDRRKKVAALAKRFNVLIVEDDPYGALRYSGTPMPSIQQFAPENVIYISTFSKILAPGLRVGFCVAPELIYKWLVKAKQACDLHTSTLSQAISAEYLSGGHLAQQLPKIIELYQPKRDAMLSAMDEYLPTSYSWTKPDGGMFVWAEGPKGMDAEQLYWKCIEQKVAFVPGKFFYPDSASQNNATLRLNFTKADEETIRSAVKTIGQVASEM